jgi:hypothetical protein
VRTSGSPDLLASPGSECLGDDSLADNGIKLQSRLAAIFSTSFHTALVLTYIPHGGFFVSRDAARQAYY